MKLLSLIGIIASLLILSGCTRINHSVFRNINGIYGPDGIYYDQFIEIDLKKDRTFELYLNFFPMDLGGDGWTNTLKGDWEYENELLSLTPKSEELENELIPFEMKPLNFRFESEFLKVYLVDTGNNERLIKK